MSESKTESARNEPESLRLRSLGVSLTADDLQATLRWYRDVLGFTVADEFEREGETVGYALVAGAVRIVINRDDGAKGRNRAKGQGLRFYFNTAQDVDAIAARIVAHGGTLDSEPADMPWGPRAFSLVDPDGFLITIASSD